MSSPSHAPAVLGGIPTTGIDIPISAVFLFLYICFAATNMTIFQKNRRRGKKFIPSVVLFGFCMARINTCILRIAWSTRPNDRGIAIAAQIFVNAGILIVYIINLIFAQRILRAKHPHVGWNPILRAGYKILYTCLGGALAMSITSVVLSMETTNQKIKQQCRDIQLASVTYLFVITLLPLIHLLVVFVMPRSAREEDFGEGSMRTKILIVGSSTCLCIIISGFKIGTAWSAPRLATNPAWYHSRAAFYVFNFVLEILALCVLTFPRIDKRFHIPNGSTKPGDYSNSQMKSLGSQITTDDQDVEL